MEPTIKIALVGAGMFGGDVHLRAYADLQRFGIAGQLARVGLDKLDARLAPVKFELVAVATRSEASAQNARRPAFKEWTGARAARVLRRRRRGTTSCATFPISMCSPSPRRTICTRSRSSPRWRSGVHVITEKPMCLSHRTRPTRSSRRRSAKNRVVAVDMHKRYDPDHLRMRDDIQKRIGAPLYGTAYLEEPLEVSTSTFKWVESSDPFSYVGPALDRSDLQLLPQQAGLAHRGRPEEAARARRHQCLRRRAGARGFRERHEHQLPQQLDHARRTSRGR